MKLSACILCRKIREIVFSDYDHKIKNINLCFDCSQFCGIFEKELDFYERELNLMILCFQCQKKFLPRKKKQTICINCYFENKKVMPVNDRPFLVIKQSNLREGWKND